MRIGDSFQLPPQSQIDVRRHDQQDEHRRGRAADCKAPLTG